MEEKIKQRLIGILVLVGSLFIILPFLFHNSRPSAEQKTASTVPSGVTPPAVSVTLPAENTAAESAAPTPATTAAINASNAPAPAANVAPNAVTATTTPAAPSAAPTQPVQSAQQPAPSAPQTQKLQTTAQAAPAKTQLAAIVPANSGKLNSNTIASRPDASGFKADEAVSPTSGLTTGVPISTPSTTEAVSSSSLADNQANSTAQPTVANAQPQSPTESTPKHSVAHHDHSVKTAHHPHHAMHAMNGKKWEIQLAVFSNERNAKKLMAKLHAHHIAAHTRRITHHGHHMMAVFVGPEFNHHKTLALQNHLHREFHLSGVVKQV